MGETIYIVFLCCRDLFGLPHIEISGMSLNQSIEAPLTNKDTAILSGEYIEVHYYFLTLEIILISVNTP